MKTQEPEKKGLPRWEVLGIIAILIFVVLFYLISYVFTAQPTPEQRRIVSSEPQQQATPVSNNNSTSSYPMNELATQVMGLLPTMAIVMVISIFIFPLLRRWERY
jgi:membrane protein YdbS with pleckstrin-like domain